MLNHAGQRFKGFVDVTQSVFIGTCALDTLILFSPVVKFSSYHKNYKED